MKTILFNRVLQILEPFLIREIDKICRKETNIMTNLNHNWGHEVFVPDICLSRSKLVSVNLIPELFSTSVK